MLSLLDHVLTEATLEPNFSHCQSLRNMLSMSLWTTPPLRQDCNSPGFYNLHSLEGRKT